MNSGLEFDSEFCNVKYIEKDNAVLLTWKKFCCFEDYRKPATFALELLGQFPNSNLIVDARNGFEDAKEDVEWGFSILIPQMAKTDCTRVVFIMSEAVNIEEEMDMWTKEFGKHFGVCRANSYEGAVKAMNSELLMHVIYITKEGKRDEFVQRVEESGIITASRQEPGNISYQYFYPYNDNNSVLLVESWTDANAQAAHGRMEHFKKLSELKKEYVENVIIKKYEAVLQ
ncbi:MAG TPA: putative quinol monooxygenase [Clostridia bacterium]|nr:putative quinol monooxygenase [Clostridia bacterium]